MEYYSESNKPKTIPMPETSKIQKVYQEVLEKDGKTKLKVIEEINLYDKIQEAKDSVILANLLEKYKIKINENNLTKIDETVIDLTNLPTNLTETLNIIDNAKLVFNQSPKEIKSFFNNNFNEFLAGAQNGTLTSLIQQINPKNKKVDGTIPQQPIQEQQTTIVQQPTEETITETKGVNLDV